MLDRTEKISFWRNEDIIDLDCPFNLIMVKGGTILGEWPGRPPGLASIFHELSLARVSYVRMKRHSGGKIFIDILAGRLVVKTNVVEKESGRKIFLNKNHAIQYASNSTRGQFIATGRRVKHHGIFCQESFAEEATHTNHIIKKLNNCGTFDDEKVHDEETELNYEEADLLDILDQYIEAEYEVDQQTARMTPPFAYFNLRPEPRSVVYRQFFRAEVDPGDLVRMREMKVSLVALETSDEEGHMAEIVDLCPSQEKDEIILSFEKQVPAEVLPKAGLLRLNALPTQRNVRQSVVEQLRTGKSANPWLLPVASGTYAYRPLKPGHVPLPPREFPPNPSQEDALHRGAGTDDFLLVLGPPGTGKTTVILDWVRYFVARGKRVLITSQSNMAVDNVLERLAQEKELQCVRLGNETKVSSAMRDILIDNFATNIQSSLIANIAETLSHLARFAGNLERFLENLPEIAGLQSHHRQLLREQAACEQALTIAQRQLVQLREELARQTEKWQKAFAKHREREESGRKRAAAQGLFSFVSRLLSKVDAARVVRLQKAMVKLAQSIEQHQGDIRQAEADMVTHQSHGEECRQKAAGLENTFTGHLDRLNPPISEMKTVVDPCLADFDPQGALDVLRQRLQQVEILQAIVGDWQKVFSGERQKSVYPLLLSMVDVVGATCIGINTSRTFKDIPFDVIIVDESGQIQLHNLIVPLSRGPRAILVGDHKQLPPVVQPEICLELENREVETELLSKSWFEVLWEQAPSDRKAMMDTQFRCPCSISDFVSKAFYDGRYKAGPNTSPDQKPPIFSFFNQPMVFLDTSGFPEQRRREKSSMQDNRPVVEGNALETQLVLEVLELALRERPDLGLNHEIGVILPYANHVREIQQAIRRDQRRRFKNLKAPLNELVASVDSFQGQERDLIIMAFTRSNRGGRVGFLRDWRRLNVAMTRTKKQLVLIGDMSTLKKFDHGKGEEAIDREFKLAMASLEDFIKDEGHFIDAATWDRRPFASGGPQSGRPADSPMEGGFTHV